MPINERYAEGGSIPVPSQLPLAAAHEVMSMTNALCDDIKRLADELLGPVPEEVENPGIPQNAGYLNALECDAHATRRSIDKAFTALQRIRNRL